MNPLELYKSVVFSIFRVLNHNSTIFSSTHKEDTCLSAIILHFPSVLWNLLTYVLSSQICLFWICHINKIVQQVIFCVWFHSFSTMSLMFAHVVHVAHTYINISFLSVEYFTIQRK